MGIASSFPFMLSESGVQISKVSLVFIATLPYGFKFILAPVIKNFINRFSVRFNCIKFISFISQIVVFILFSILGIFAQNQNMFLAFVCIFLLTTVVSINEVVVSHVKLVSFEKTKLGIPTSISNFGFRIGSFMAGYLMLYISDLYSWKTSFFLASLSIVFLTVSTFLLPEIKQKQIKIEKEFFKFYLGSFIKFFKKYNIWIFVLIIFSFKFSDSCVNSLKPLFLQFKGLSKTDFANVAQIPGVVCLTIGGFIAGMVSYKSSMKNCIILSLLGQIAASIIFIIISFCNLDLFSMLICVACSTLCFGFSNVTLRTYFAQKSNTDIVIYTTLLSIGSILRIFCSYLGGILVDYTSWQIVFICCILSNFPLLFFCEKLLKKQEVKSKL